MHRIGYSRVRRYRPRRIRPKRYRRHHRFTRRVRVPTRKVALRKSGNVARFTAKNNVNLFLYWPVGTAIPSGQIHNIVGTQVLLTYDRIISANRQFRKNVDEYQYMKFNYIAVKVSDVAHMCHDVPAEYGTNPQYISVGINNIAGNIPLNVNWDVEQDFSFDTGHEGSVDAEGFAQHPGTKQIRPGSKYPVTFLWRVPKHVRQFVSTDKVKNSSKIDFPLTDFFDDIMGIKNIRAPTYFSLSLPSFWAQFLPNVPNPGLAIKTYFRMNVYLGVTFRGRRTMGANQTNDLVGISTVVTVKPDKDESDSELDFVP